MATSCCETGEYTGNGTSQTIIVGWQPTIVTVFRWTGGAERVCFKMSSLADDDYAILASKADLDSADGITIISTGFTVGSDWEVNDNGETFYWTAIR